MSSVFSFTNFVHGGHFSWGLTTRILILFVSSLCRHCFTVGHCWISQWKTQRPHLAFPLYVPKWLEFRVSPLKPRSPRVSVLTTLHYFFQERQPLCHLNCSLPPELSMFCFVLLCCRLLDYFSSVCWISAQPLSVIFPTCFHLRAPFLCLSRRVLKTVSYIISLVLGVPIVPLLTFIYLWVLQWYYLWHQFLSSSASCLWSHSDVLSSHLWSHPPSALC